MLDEATIRQRARELGVRTDYAEFPGSPTYGCFVEHQLGQLLVGDIYV